MKKANVRLAFFHIPCYHYSDSVIHLSTPNVLLIIIFIKNFCHFRSGIHTCMHDTQFRHIVHITHSVHTHSAHLGLSSLLCIIFMGYKLAFSLRFSRELTTEIVTERFQMRLYELQKWPGLGELQMLLRHVQSKFAV